MCTGKIDLSSYFELLCEKEVLNHLGKLEEMEADGILTLSGGKLRFLEVTERGKPFLRNICMIFDEYLQKKNEDGPRFSRTI
jgi:oxygen-independent coproporphyrinogen-3 oxidase